MRLHIRLPLCMGWLWVALVLVACKVATSTPTLAPAASPTSPPEETPYWPTQGWRTSTPEQQGIDSSMLVEMLDDIQKQGDPIHGVLIVRNGYLVLEAYFHPYQPESRHYLASVTKSFTSALVGMAIDKGYIDGVYQKLLDFFPGRTVANVDSRKEAITLEHLLTMSSGLDWPTRDTDELLWPQFAESEDWVQFALDRPVSTEPGTAFNYNSSGSHLLSAILQQATGMTALDFAQKNLFIPLGITNVTWFSDPNGINMGAMGLNLTPRDMAKFGYLYLNGGVWEGQPVVPAAWVKSSRTGHIDSVYPASRYGYQWWVDQAHVYKAAGAGGQRIFVMPDQAMVVVFVSGIPFSDPQNLAEMYLESYILPAVKSSKPLPPNAEGAALLESRIRSLAAPQPEAVPPFPAMAQSISGKTYSLNANVFGIDAFSLNFSQDQASLKTYSTGGTQELAIGLDGVYRLTRSQPLPGAPPPSPIALKGSWLGSDTLSLSLFEEGNLTDLQLVFEGEQVNVNIRTDRFEQNITGTAEKKAYPALSPKASPGQHPYSSNVQIETSGHLTQTVEVNYLLYLPDSYGQDPQQKWPLILFLHGRGERGEDLELLKKHPLPKLLEARADFPFIVVSPQQSLQSLSWSDKVDPLNALLDQIRTIYSVDPQRIYLTGLSMGGYGAWELALRYPERFAAVVPIAGGYPGPVPGNICALRDVPLWVFHGEMDTIVPPSESEVLVEALQACGANVRFTLYPDADHEGSFLQAYADHELYQWLLAQKQE